MSVGRLSKSGQYAHSMRIPLSTSLPSTILVGWHPIFPMNDKRLKLSSCSLSRSSGDVPASSFGHALTHSRPPKNILVRANRRIFIGVAAKVNRLPALVRCPGTRSLWRPGTVVYYDVVCVRRALISA